MDSLARREKKFLVAVMEAERSKLVGRVKISPSPSSPIKTITSPHNNNNNHHHHQQQQQLTQDSQLNLKNVTRNCKSRSSASSLDHNRTKRHHSNLRPPMMMFNYLALLLSLACLMVLAASFTQVSEAADLQAVLRNFSINPDTVTIPSYTETIRVILNNNEVKPGDRVPAKTFKDLKNDKISWSVSSLDARHTLILVDLDRRSPGVNQSHIYNQYTSLNMPGNDINLGQTIVAFEQPVVPCVQPSAKHRMLMLALHQPQQIDLADVTNIAASSGNSEKRKNFDLRDFIRKNQLTVIAANAFYAMAGDAQGICSGAMSSLVPQSSALLIVTLLTLIAAYMTAKQERH